MNRRSGLRLALGLIGLGVFSAVYFFKAGAGWLEYGLGIGGLLLASLSYFYCLHLTDQDDASFSLRFILVSALLLRLAALPLPVFWDDLFYRPLWDGWLQASLLNPFHYIPGSDILIAQQSSRLFDLLNHTQSHTAFGAAWQLLYGPAGWLFDHFGMATAVLWLKGLSIGVDLLLLGVLFRVPGKGSPTKAALLYGWNPMIILFISGQGLLFQLQALLLATFFLLWKSNRRRGALVAWSGVVLTSPLGWIGLPYLGKRFGWKSILAILGISLLFWLPYLYPQLPRELYSGLHDAWSYPDPLLTPGYLATFFLVRFAETSGFYWMAAVAALMTLVILSDAWQHPAPNEEDFSRQLWILGSVFFLAGSEWAPGMLAALFVLASLKRANRNFYAVLSCLFMLQLWFFISAAWLPVIIFAAAVTALLLLKYFGTGSWAGRFLSA